MVDALISVVLGVAIIVTIVAGWRVVMLIINNYQNRRKWQ